MATLSLSSMQCTTKCRQAGVQHPEVHGMNWKAMTSMKLTSGPCVGLAAQHPQTWNICLRQSIYPHLQVRK